MLRTLLEQLPNLFQAKTNPFHGVNGGSISAGTYTLGQENEGRPPVPLVNDRVVITEALAAELQAGLGRILHRFVGLTEQELVEHPVLQSYTQGWCQQMGFRNTQLPSVVPLVAWVVARRVNQMYGVVVSPPTPPRTLESPMSLDQCAPTQLLGDVPLPPTESGTQCAEDFDLTSPPPIEPPVVDPVPDAAMVVDPAITTPPPPPTKKTRPPRPPKKIPLEKTDPETKPKPSRKRTRATPTPTKTPDSAAPTEIVTISDTPTDSAVIPPKPKKIRAPKKPKQIPSPPADNGSLEATLPSPDVPTVTVFV